VRKRERVGEMKRETDIEIERDYAYFFIESGESIKRKMEKEKKIKREGGRERVGMTGRKSLRKTKEKERKG
jgi:hypothetical protein